MIDVIEAEDAWCPPTLTPDGVTRTLFAQWTMLVASQRIRVSIERSTSRSRASAAGLRVRALKAALRLQTSLRRQEKRFGMRRRIQQSRTSAFAGPAHPAPPRSSRLALAVLPERAQASRTTVAHRP